MQEFFGTVDWSIWGVDQPLFTEFIQHLYDLMPTIWAWQQDNALFIEGWFFSEYFTQGTKYGVNSHKWVSGYLRKTLDSENGPPHARYDIYFNISNIVIHSNHEWKQKVLA